jgi:transcriptional regulator with XRE-family HTH domain
MADYSAAGSAAPTGAGAASGMKSAAVTAPPVASEIRPRNPHDGRLLPLHHRDTAASVAPTSTANSACFKPFFAEVCRELHVVNLHHSQVARQAKFAGQCIASEFPHCETAGMTDDLHTLPDGPEKRAALRAHQIKALGHISDWLRYRNLRQKDLALALNVSEGMISRYLAGEALMSVGHLRQIAVLLQAHEGDLLRPPPSEGLGPTVEETLAEINRLGPDKWAKVLATAKEMRGKSDG